MIYTKSHIDLSRQMFMDGIRRDVRQNGKVQIPGFGTFKLVKRKAHTKLLPSGKTISVPAKSVARFIPAKKFLAHE